MATRNSVRRISLKRLLSPKKGTYRTLDDQLKILGSPVAVQDEQGQFLLGDETLADQRVRVPISVGDSEYGWVIGPEHASTVADLIAYLLERESERRDLGAELLDSYREINLLYTLSERLSQSLELETVAAVALEEAKELLSGTAGAVFLFEPTTSLLSPAAQFGDHYMGAQPKEGLIGEVIDTSKGQILNPESNPNSGEESTFAIACAPLKTKGDSIGVIVVDSETTYFTAADLKRLNTVAAQAGPAIENSLLYARQVALTNSYSRFVPPEFLSFLGKDSIVDVELGDYVHKEMAIMVSDIQGFTTLSEKMTPKENFRFINEFLASVSPIIRESNGFIVKYMGDGLMALFPGGVDDAIRAALATVERVNRQHDRHDGGDIRIGIGLNTGTMMVGTVGESERMQGDIFSDAVNLTARLEGLTRDYGVDIVISEQALAAMGSPEAYEVRLLGETKVKGRQEVLQVYEIQAGRQETV